MIELDLGSCTSPKKLATAFDEWIRTQADGFRAILQKNGANDDQLKQVECLLGHGSRVALMTEADIDLLPYRSEQLRGAASQLLQAYPNADFTLGVYPMVPTSPTDRHDLKVQRRAIEPQLKREFDAYVARVVVSADQETSDYAAAVFAIRLNAKKRDARTDKPRKKRGRTTPPLQGHVLAPVTNAEGIAILSAQFWAAGHHDLDLQDVNDSKSDARSKRIHRLIAQGLMPLDRTCFGHGVGKLVVRALVNEMKARAVTNDVLRKSPLQPQAITSLLASLPIDKHGNTAGLPAIRLP